MRNTGWRGLVVVMAMACACVAQSAAAGPGQDFRTFVPSWSKGMQWTVEAQYRIHEGGVPGPRRREPSWSEPVRWRFRVMERSRDRNLEIFRLRAEQISGPGKSVTGYFFIGERSPAGELRSLALARVAYRPTQAPGEPESADFTSLATAPFPIVNELSLTPGDFPMFEAPETVRAPERSTSYEVTEGSSGMYFSRDLKQTVRRARVEAGDGRVKVGLPPQAETLEYTIVRPSDGAGFRQLWTAAAPWFVYSESGRMKAWLVDSTH